MYRYGPKNSDCVQLESQTEITAKIKPFDAPLASICKPRLHHRLLRWSTSSLRMRNRPKSSGIAQMIMNMDNVPENAERIRNGSTRPTV